MAASKITFVSSKHQLKTLSGAANFRKKRIRSISKCCESSSNDISVNSDHNLILNELADVEHCAKEKIDLFISQESDSAFSTVIHNINADDSIWQEISSDQSNSSSSQVILSSKMMDHENTVESASLDVMPSNNTDNAISTKGCNHADRVNQENPEKGIDLLGIIVSTVCDIDENPKVCSSDSVSCSDFGPSNASLFLNNSSNVENLAIVKEAFDAIDQHLKKAKLADMELSNHVHKECKTSEVSADQAPSVSNNEHKELLFSQQSIVPSTYDFDHRISTIKTEPCDTFNDKFNISCEFVTSNITGTYVTSCDESVLKVHNVSESNRMSNHFIARQVRPSIIKETPKFEHTQIYNNTVGCDDSSAATETRTENMCGNEKIFCCRPLVNNVDFVCTPNISQSNCSTKKFLTEQIAASDVFLNTTSSGSKIEPKLENGTYTSNCAQELADKNVEETEVHSINICNVRHCLKSQYPTNQDNGYCLSEKELNCSPNVLWHSSNSYRTRPSSNSGSSVIVEGSSSEFTCGLSQGQHSSNKNSNSVAELRNTQERFTSTYALSSEPRLCNLNVQPYDASSISFSNQHYSNYWTRNPDVFGHYQYFDEPQLEVAPYLGGYHIAMAKVGHIEESHCVDEEVPDGDGSCHRQDHLSDITASACSSGRSKADRLCRVCGDRALGYNFNAVTCESCKAFFRRNALKNKVLKCPFQNHCTVDVVTRRFCQKCRLSKCFEIGMKKEWIMSDEEKRQKKEKIEANKQRKIASATFRGFTTNSDAPDHDFAEQVSSDTSEDTLPKAKTCIRKSIRPKSNDISDAYSVYEGTISTDEHSYDVDHSSTDEHLSEASFQDSAPPISSSPLQSECESIARNSISATWAHSSGEAIAPCNWTRQDSSSVSPFSRMEGDRILCETNECDIRGSGVCGAQISSSATVIINSQQSKPQAVVIGMVRDRPTGGESTSKMMRRQSQLDVHNRCSQSQPPFADSTELYQQNLSTASPPRSASGPPHTSRVMTQGNQHTSQLLLRRNNDNNVTVLPASSLQGPLSSASYDSPGTTYQPAVESQLYSNNSRDGPVLERMLPSTSSGIPSTYSQRHSDAVYDAGPSTSMQEFFPDPLVQSSCSASSFITPASHEHLISHRNHSSSHIKQEPGETGEAASFGSSCAAALARAGSEDKSWSDFKVSDALQCMKSDDSKNISNMVGDIVNCAVKAEYLVHPASQEAVFEENSQSDLTGMASALGDSSSVRLQGLNSAERRKLLELHNANQAMLAPLSEDKAYNHKEQHDPSLINVINMTDIAIRRLIQMSKQLVAFTSLCTEDQIALLKGGCTEMMILRSVAAYDADKDSWKIPEHRDSFKSIKLKVLQGEPGGVQVYEEHKKFILAFKPEWRHDQSIMLLLSAISLFTPSRANVKHPEAILLEQCSYLYLLKRYLESSLGGCEGKKVYVGLLSRINDLRRLNDNHLRVFMQVNPEDVRPLLIEIFDLKQR